MWTMLQQPEPDDYVIATGESHSLEEFAEAAFSGVELEWREHVVIDPALLRPADITIGRANPSKAAERLGWQARHKMRDVVRMMVEEEGKGQRAKGEEQRAKS
jgi:GDPmannose 4,6-dehydratase